MKKFFSLFTIIALMFAVSAQAKDKPVAKAKSSKTKAVQAKKPAKKTTPETTESAPVLDENGQPVRTMQDELLSQ